MNAFTIRDIENLCGIKAHTLRVWEQRYQLCCPKRKAGNHRLYDNDDLKFLLRIAFLYHNGHKISSLARLNEKELCGLAMQIPLSDGANDIFVNDLLEASLNFDQEGFDRILHSVILHMGFEKAITQVAWPFLQKIGLLWLTGNVVPAQEHFASTLIIKKLLVAINGLESPAPPRPGGRHVLLFTPAGEFHEMPLLFMRYMMKKNGITTIYPGPNISLEELKDCCAHQPVTHLYFHLVTNLVRCEPGEYVRQLVDLFPDKQIILSGSRGIDLHWQHNRVRVLKDPEEMQAFAKGH